MKWPCLFIIGHLIHSQWVGRTCLQSPSTPGMCIWLADMMWVLDQIPNRPAAGWIGTRIRASILRGKPLAFEGGVRAIVDAFFSTTDCRQRQSCSLRPHQDFGIFPFKSIYLRKLYVFVSPKIPPTTLALACAWSCHGLVPVSFEQCLL